MAKDKEKRSLLKYLLNLCVCVLKPFHSGKSVDQSMNTNGKYHHVTCDHKIFKIRIDLRNFF